jgi:hypothetical protein
VEADCVNTPEEFAAANSKAELESLKSLTLEKAAEELESILNSWAEIERSLEATGMPPPLPNPLPGPSLAILLAGKPSADD